MAQGFTKLKMTVPSQGLKLVRSHALVTTDPEVMGGVPVFAGTRVPVAIVLGSLATGIQLNRLKGSYPFLTEAHIRAAKVYETVHPRRGRPRRFADVNPELSRRVTQVIKPGTKT